MTTVEVLRLAQTGLFMAVGVWAAVRWRRHGTSADRWLAATFGVLGVGVFVSTLAGGLPDGDTTQWLRRANLMVVSTFPYLLVRFLDTLRAVPRRPTIVLGLAVLGLGLAALFLPEVPAPDEPRGATYRAWVAGLAAVWLIVLPWVSVRLWRAGSGRPTIPRRRMRTLALATASLSVALLLAGAIEDPNSSLGIAVLLAAMAAAVLFLVGFVPPRTLRTLWRQPEERRFQEIATELVASADPREIAVLVAPYAREVIGAGAAEIRHRGEVLASDGTPPVETEPMVLPLPDGEIRVWPDAYVPFFGEDDVAGLRNMALLVELALARAELQRMALLVGSSETDDDLVTEVLHTARHQLRARTCALLLDHDGRPRIAACVGDEHVLDGLGTWVGLLELVDAPSSPARPVVVPVSNDRGPSGSLVVWFDGASEQRRGQLQLARTLGSFLNLALAIQHRRDLERRLIHELQATSDVRRDFVASISHELRTPLTSIRGFARMLTERADAIDEPTRQALLARIRDRADDLTELVERLLEVAGTDATDRSTVELEPVPVGPLVRSLAARVAHETGQTLEVDVAPVAAWADAERLQRVLQELVANAIKFTPAHATVQLTAAANGTSVLLEVTDDGPGLEQREVDQVFDPFYRSRRAVAEAIPGAGLGLALARAQVTAMGGEIDVSSRRGHGTTLRVRLPIAQEAATPPQTAATAVSRAAEAAVVPHRHRVDRSA